MSKKLGETMIIGLTGGIASGKTAVSDFLKKEGYLVVDADVLSREVVKRGSAGLAEIVQAFGREMLEEDGSLNRKALAARIFTDEEARKTLDGITHPKIEALAKEKLSAKAKEDKAFFVVPLLFESGMDALCDEVWLVHASDEIRLERLKIRDGIDEDYAKNKIASQMSEEERQKRADKIIENTGDLLALKEKVKKMLK